MLNGNNTIVINLGDVKQFYSYFYFILIGIVFVILLLRVDIFVSYIAMIHSRIRNIREIEDVYIKWQEKFGISSVFARRVKELLNTEPKQELMYIFSKLLYLYDRRKITSLEIKAYFTHLILEHIENELRKNPTPEFESIGGYIEEMITELRKLERFDGSSWRVLESTLMHMVKSEKELYSLTPLVEKLSKKND